MDFLTKEMTVGRVTPFDAFEFQAKQTPAKQSFPRGFLARPERLFASLTPDGGAFGVVPFGHRTLSLLIRSQITIHIAFNCV